MIFKLILDPYNIKQISNNMSQKYKLQNTIPGAPRVWLRT